MTRLPLTIVSGYLGAGKTTLINRLLAEDHGLRLMVIVNDFGAINIDQTLIETAENETIALTNGCVCCTMGPDLFRALDQALDRDPRPDHLIIEASGIADPAAIANAAIAEPEISYAGIVTLVDGASVADLLADGLVAPQVEQQIAAADLLLVTKEATPSPALLDRVQALGGRAPRLLDNTPLSDLLFDVTPLPRQRRATAHPAYASWQHDSDKVLNRAALGDKLAARPEGLYRFKGFVLTDDGPYEVHVVGRYVQARRARAERTQVVGLGPADRITAAEIEAWWSEGN